MHWFASERLVEDLRDLNKQSSRCPEHLIRGVRALLNALNTWAADQNVCKTNQNVIDNSSVCLEVDNVCLLNRTERERAIRFLNGSLCISCWRTWAESYDMQREIQILPSLPVRYRPPKQPSRHPNSRRISQPSEFDGSLKRAQISLISTKLLVTLLLKR